MTPKTPPIPIHHGAQHRPAAEVATVVGIFQAPHVENDRRQWLDGVARARVELGDDTFRRLVSNSAAKQDHEAIAFLCGMGRASQDRAQPRPTTP